MAITTKAEAEALTVEELKTELTGRGLPTEGLKVKTAFTFFGSTDRGHVLVCWRVSQLCFVRF